MTKPTSKPSQATKSKPRPVVVYGLDEHNKPRAAAFATVDPELLAKAAAASDLEIYPITSKALKQLAAQLPAGQLDPKGVLIAPYIEMPLYRKLFDILATRDQAAAAPEKIPVVPTELPETWDQIAPGHLVIAQESLEYGWGEAVVLERYGETLKLKYRDYPSLPKFTRPVVAVALLTPAPAVGGEVQGGT